MSSYCVDMLLIFTHHFYDISEEICISSVHTKEKLLRSFKSCIESSQNRILWLSNKEMDEQVANVYPTYLGHLCDLSKTITELSRKYSFEKSELPK